jgi:hypothetical protein
MLCTRLCPIRNGCDRLSLLNKVKEDEASFKSQPEAQKMKLKTFGGNWPKLKKNAHS